MDSLAERVFDLMRDYLPAWLVGTILVLALVGLPFLWYAERRCSICKEAWSLRRTGEKRGDFISREAEWKCQRCGHVVWRGIPTAG